MEMTVTQQWGSNERSARNLCGARQSPKQKFDYDGFDEIAR